ncbi:hypothetical protein NE857_28990 [Nocardiopsis exhalans]|uniref:Uncharacterized protein n=1 Tax=Nocardiopsis exhalans TaxID=163604 RepID=A0ABY5D6Z0_9ACTN|nr:hypothetical protein [Nocardiopsis exhalans]USY19248.1 hypothetical protein NE857_28990 [Nocardiopsis exhalans]
MDTAAELRAGSEDGHGKSATPVRQMSLWPPPRATRYRDKRRRQFTKVTVAAAVLLLLGGGGFAAWAYLDGSGDDAVTTAPDPDEFVGSWSGPMSQVDTDGEPVAEWDAEVRIEEGAERGSTTWSTFSCSGTLELSARDGDRLVYSYTEISDPEDRCVDESELTLWPVSDGGGLNAEWSSVTREGTRMVSTGTLG